MERKIIDTLNMPIDRRSLIKKGVPFLCAATRVLSNLPATVIGTAYKDISTLLPPEPSPLKKYLNSIKDEYQKFLPKIKTNDLFSGFKNFTREQQIEDFDIYFPLYKAGEIAQEIPWFLLWIIHADETTVSRDKNPDQDNQKGAMQIINDHAKELKNATLGWEFLHEIDEQRYLTRHDFLTNDWEEILKASLFIRNRTSPKAKTPSEQENSILHVVETQYSAPKFGKARILQYHKIKELLTL